MTKSSIASREEMSFDMASPDDGSPGRSSGDEQTTRGSRTAVDQTAGSNRINQPAPSPPPLWPRPARHTLPSRPESDAPTRPGPRPGRTPDGAESRHCGGVGSGANAGSELERPTRPPGIAARPPRWPCQCRTGSPGDRSRRCTFLRVPFSADASADSVGRVGPGTYDSAAVLPDARPPPPVVERGRP